MGLLSRFKKIKKAEKEETQKTRVHECCHTVVRFFEAHIKHYAQFIEDRENERWVFDNTVKYLQLLGSLPQHDFVKFEMDLALVKARDILWDETEFTQHIRKWGGVE